MVKMKIAMVFGKGLDGCGVEKYAAVFKDYLKEDIDIYNLLEHKYTRGGYHLGDRRIDFIPEEIESIAQKLNEYDIVIYNSYAFHANEPSTVRSFFFDLIEKVTKPITVGMMHEIKKMNYEKIPMLVAITNSVDQMYNFSTHSDYSKAAINILQHKPDRIRKFRMPMNINYSSVPFSEKEKRIIYAGRWTTMKGPRRLLNFLDIPNNEFKSLLIGIEKSIGAKTDILDHPNAIFFKKTKDFINFDNFKEDVKINNVFGPYKYEFGQDLIRKSMFGYSGFTLPKEPQNYGDRMEFQQMEIFINGTLPVFDRHYGENNFDSTGKRFIDNKKIALWSSKPDLSDVYDDMIKISKDEDLYNEYIQNGKEFIYREVSSDIVIPEFIDEIVKVGKEKNKLSFEELIKRTHGEDGYKNFTQMANEFPNNSLSFNIKDCVRKEISYFVNTKKRQVYTIKTTETLNDW